MFGTFQGGEKKQIRGSHHKCYNIMQREEDVLYFLPVILEFGVIQENYLARTDKLAKCYSLSE